MGIDLNNEPVFVRFTRIINRNKYLDFVLYTYKHAHKQAKSHNLIVCISLKITAPSSERSGIGGLALRSVLTGKHTRFWPPAISLLPISHHSPATVYLIPTISVRLP